MNRVIGQLGNGYRVTGRGRRMSGRLSGLTLSAMLVCGCGGDENSASSESGLGQAGASSAMDSSAASTSSAAGTSSDGSDATSNGAGTSDPSTADPTDDQAGTNSGGSANTIPGADSCETVQCLRAYECVAECGGAMLSSGCCPCEGGTIDRVTECSDAADTTGDNQSNNAGDPSRAGASAGPGNDSGDDSGSAGASGAQGGTGGRGQDSGGNRAGSASAQSGAGNDGDAGAGNNPGGSGSAPECELFECFRVVECVEECGGVVVSSGCCPCEGGTIDSGIECNAE